MRMIGRLTTAAMMLACLAVAGLAQDSTQVLRQNDPGVTAPGLVKDVKPVYTDEAKEAGIQGVVELEAVVLTDGTVGDITITRSLDRKYGLDQQAILALKQWVFSPGKKDGKAVPVAVTIEMTFTLK
jgi:TonB family protein